VHRSGRKRGVHANAVLSAVGHNLRRVLRWPRIILPDILAALIRVVTPKSAINPAC
jgi:hypothetical protein